jgi:tRNA threonylcarbamoyladenosine biosynthesis protein TsaE
MIGLTLASPAQTRKLARVLAVQLRPPALVTVEGDLGTGKTTLVREVLRARGVRGAITSPSFTLAQSYHGRCGEQLHHLDLYRLSRGVDAELFAWDDYLGPDAITFVEWPAAGSEALPPADLRVELEHRTPNSRTARLLGAAVLETAITAGAEEAGLRVAAPPRASTKDTP